MKLHRCFFHIPYPIPATHILYAYFFFLLTLLPKCNRYFDKALELYPNHSSLHLKYAGFLRHARRDLIGADKHYELAILKNPQNSDALGSYASFLHGVIGNMEGAAKHYEQAMKIDLTHANNLCNYGLFLRSVFSVLFFIFVCLILPRIVCQFVFHREFTTPPDQKMRLNFFHFFLLLYSSEVKNEYASAEKYYR